ncbi:MAG: hypothetical protein ACR2PT_20490 [Endozoicomonas sp.]
MSAIPPGGGSSSTTHVDGVAKDEAEKEDLNTKTHWKRRTSKGPDIHNNPNGGLKRFRGVKAVDTSSSPSVRRPAEDANPTTDASSANAEDDKS